MTPLQSVCVVLFLSAKILLGEYNYLCDFSTQFTSNTVGTWIVQSGCQVVQTNQYANGSVAWLGGDTSTLSWTDYIIECTFRITAINTSPSAGILFRATSIGNNWDSGIRSYYLVTLQPNDNRIYNAVLNNDNYQLDANNSYITIDTYIDYTLRIEVSGNYWTIYLNGTQRHSGSDTSFSAGSIGLRTEGCAVIFKTLYITFPTTASPTHSPTETTTYPTIHPTEPKILSIITSPIQVKPSTKSPTVSSTLEPDTNQSDTTQNLLLWSILGASLIFLCVILIVICAVINIKRRKKLDIAIETLQNDDALNNDKQKDDNHDGIEQMYIDSNFSKDILDEHEESVEKMYDKLHQETDTGSMHDTVTAHSHRPNNIHSNVSEDILDENEGNVEIIYDNLTEQTEGNTATLSQGDV